MKIFVGPDSLKGSLKSVEFCNIAERVISKHWPQDEVIKVPLADGGEGTVEALVYNTAGCFKTVEVKDPLGRPVQATYGILGNGDTAVIEMAEASGITLLEECELNPMIASTFGTGEIIKAAIMNGCKRILLGIGGSATTDGGMGMLQALGFRCLDEHGESVRPGGEGLLALRNIIPPEYNPYQKIEIKVACDVTNPLFGLNGAAHIYGPQKGADPAMVKVLDEGLKNFARVMKKDLGFGNSSYPGCGAAGGMGAGLMAGLGAELVHGFNMISQELKLDEKLKGIDLVITAEGEMNSQSYNGKLPVELSKLAKRHNIPVVAIVGSRNMDDFTDGDHGIDAVFSIVSGPMSLGKAMLNSEALVSETILHVMRLIHAVSLK